MAMRKVHVLYFHPKARCPTREPPKRTMKTMLAAMFGAYPRDDPFGGQSGPISEHFMDAIV